MTTCCSRHFFSQCVRQKGIVIPFIFIVLGLILFIVSIHLKGSISMIVFDGLITVLSTIVLIYRITAELKWVERQRNQFRTVHEDTALCVMCATLTPSDDTHTFFGKCSHKIHMECANEWFERRKDCPACYFAETRGKYEFYENV